MCWCPGVILGFIGVDFLVHDDHGHPLVHCEDYPGVVLFEFCEGPVLGRVYVTLVVVL